MTTIPSWAPQGKATVQSYLNLVFLVLSRQTKGKSNKSYFSFLQSALRWSGATWQRLREKKQKNSYLKQREEDFKEECCSNEKKPTLGTIQGVSGMKCGSQFNGWWWRLKIMWNGKPQVKENFVREMKNQTWRKLYDGNGKPPVRDFERDLWWRPRLISCWGRRMSSRWVLLLFVQFSNVFSGFSCFLAIDWRWEWNLWQKLVRTSTFWRNVCMRPNNVVTFRLFAGNVTSADIC